jgi:Methyltransferase domain
MHPEAREWVAKHATSDRVDLLDIGGRNINGCTRDLFPNATCTVLDITPGRGVDIVADASTWEPTGQWDVILCTEVFEHTPAWPQILVTAHEACRPNGVLIATMAGPGRPVHSGYDGGPVLFRGEQYANVDWDELELGLGRAGWINTVLDYQVISKDMRCTARKSGWAVHV